MSTVTVFQVDILLRSYQLLTYVSDKFSFNKGGSNCRKEKLLLL